MQSKHSSIDVFAILKNLRRFAHHPWIGKKLVALQAEKLLFDHFFPRYENGIGGRIRQLSFRLTDICNLRCATCGQWGETGFLRSKDIKELKKQEVPRHRYVELLDDCVKKGERPILYLWGGEPMLYDGVLDLIDTATQMGLPTSIATNGTRIASVAPRLVKAPLFLMQISIDGHCAEIHDQLRPSVSGASSFKKIVDGLQAVQEERRVHNSDLPLIASLTVISQGNARHLTDLYDAFRDKVDLFVFYLAWWIDEKRARAQDRDFSRRFGFTPKIHWGWVSNAKWKLNDYEILQEQIDALRARSRAWNDPPVILIPDITGVDNLQRYYTDHACRFGFDRCISIYQAMEVDSNGDVSPCRDYHDYVVGNVKEATLMELWNSPAYVRFRQSISREGLMPVCSRCCGLMGY
ncbi:MAG: radical SAM protein [Deltaproteobacteria bacterium]|nr:radical SAM protein [Deltaproteobacteria bacterium]